MKKSVLPWVLASLLAITGCWTIASYNDASISSPPAVYDPYPIKQDGTDRIGHDIVNPTVQLIINGKGGGTGVIIAKDKILTACHVVVGAKSIMATQMINDNITVDTDVTLEEADPVHDLAILKTTAKWAGIASIIKQASDLHLNVFAFTYGYPGSLQTQIEGILSGGWVSCLKGRKYVPGRTITMTSVPVGKGNSGGGLFVFVDGEWQLAGIGSVVLLQPLGQEDYQMVNTVSGFVTASDMLEFIGRSK